jgi:hypothetical protein
LADLIESAIINSIAPFRCQRADNRGEIVYRLLDGRDELLDTPDGRVFNGFHQQLGVGRSSRPQRSSSISDRTWIMGFLLM